MCNVNKELNRLLKSELIGTKRKTFDLVDILVHDENVTENECMKIIEVIQTIVKERMN